MLKMEASDESDSLLFLVLCLLHICFLAMHVMNMSNWECLFPEAGSRLLFCTADACLRSNLIGNGRRTTDHEKTKSIIHCNALFALHR